jgi:RHS repeat-associated protein
MSPGADSAGPAWTVLEGNLVRGTANALYETDVRGRRTKKIERRDSREVEDPDVTEYVWDCRDRLREVQLPSGERVRYTYDAFARRVRKEIAPAPKPVKEADDVKLLAAPDPVRVVAFLWDGSALAQETDSERGKRVHVQEPRSLLPLLQEENGRVYLVVCDQVGTPKELIDAEGNVAWAASHTAWGRVVESVAGDGTKEHAVESPFRLLGQYADEETGLAYTRFRYFDADVARWLSPDPLGLLGGRNLFAFDGAPTNDVDPLGLARDPNACQGKVAYGSTKLSKAVQARRLRDAETEGKTYAKGGNYSAARLEDGTILTGRSSGELHAEEDVIRQAGNRPIVDLYSEREPCQNKCQALTQGMNVTWSWDWNGVDRGASNRDLNASVGALFK